MENKNNTWVIVLLVLIAGLLIGYFANANNMMSGVFWNGGMHEVMEEQMGGFGHMHDDGHHHANELSKEDLIRQDGAMQHAMEEMMLGLRGKTGDAYEEAFLKMMIVHHIGAIEMVEDLLEETDRPELTAMANDIITAQRKEVEMMKGWLETWFNSNE